jgi:hypothetical protein
MDSEELLAQLADIHLPEAVSYWPPALGWWVLAVILLVLLFMGIKKLSASQRLGKIRKYALDELENCYFSYAEATDTDSNALKLGYVNQFNSILRRVALYHYPHSHVASLSGQRWLDFIVGSGDSELMNEEIASSLKEGRFQKQCDVDVEKMHEFGRSWVTSLYRPQESAGSSSSDNEGLGSNA